MDFLDNVMKSSNALLKEHLNNPFANKQQANTSKQGEPQSGEQSTSSATDQASTAVTTDTDANNQAATENVATSNEDDPLAEGENGDKNSRFAAIAADAEAVTQKAAQGAKNIGSFLFSMANKAGQHVQQTAKQVKQAVESTSILTDFTREQQEFIREHGGSMQAGELPWANCTDEAKCADIREQILSLSQDKRNFVRSPPNDANYQFEPQQCYPIALSLLREDPNLSKMRFELVPKLVKEDVFWRNYFYRVSLLKQMSDRGEDVKRQGWSSSRSSSGEGPDEDLTGTSASAATIDEPNQIGDTETATQVQERILNSGASTAIQELESSESRKLVAEADDLKSKLRELNIGSFDGGSQDEDDKWDEELQRDLQEFELVSGDVSALDEEALDKDIMELKNSAKKG